MELFFDTETSGYLNKKLEPDHPDQNWVCQIAAILSTKDEIISTMNILIKANGRKMNQWLVDNLHGISAEKADAEGIEEVDALEQFAHLMKDSPKRICHNFNFDNGFIDQMFQRNMDELSDEARSKYFLQLPSFCTMEDKKIKKFCNTKDKNGRLKKAKLEEMYEILFEEKMNGAHDAMVDVETLRKCYYKLIDKGVIEPC